MFAALPKATPAQILEKFRLNFPINEDLPPQEIAVCKEKVINFDAYLRKVIPVIEMMQSEARKIRGDR